MGKQGTLESIRFCVVCTTFELILGYRYVVELLTEAVSFVEKLESHLQSAKSIPQIPTLMKNMVSSKKKKKKRASQCSLVA